MATSFLQFANMAWIALLYAKLSVLFSSLVPNVTYQENVYRISSDKRKTPGKWVVFQSKESNRRVVHIKFFLQRTVIFMLVKVVVFRDL